MPTDFSQFADIAEQAARRAGAILADWSHRFTVSEKSRANLVTEADFASQEAIYRFISERYPDHDFLGEEGLNRSTGADYCWIIDPLDGTSNYVHGFPYFAVSIALEYQHQLAVGVVFDPNRDEMFQATRGGGASCNGTSLQTSDVSDLEQAMAVASLPIAPDPSDIALQRFLGALQHVQTVQRTGSAALNLAYTACGRLDVYWSSSLKPWDMAAGALLVREAGGSVSKIDGAEFQVRESDLLATNGSVHAGMVSVLTECNGE